MARFGMGRSSGSRSISIVSQKPSPELLKPLTDEELRAGQHPFGLVSRQQLEAERGGRKTSLQPITFGRPFRVIKGKKTFEPGTFRITRSGGFGGTAQILAGANDIKGQKFIASLIKGNVNQKTLQRLGLSTSGITIKAGTIKPIKSARSIIKLPSVIKSADISKKLTPSERKLLKQGVSKIGSNLTEDLKVFNKKARKNEIEWGLIQAKIAAQKGSGKPFTSVESARLNKRIKVASEESASLAKEGTFLEGQSKALKQVKQKKKVQESALVSGTAAQRFLAGETTALKEVGLETAVGLNLLKGVEITGKKGSEFAKGVSETLAPVVLPQFRNSIPARAIGKGFEAFSKASLGLVPEAGLFAFGTFQGLKKLATPKEFQKGLEPAVFKGVKEFGELVVTKPGAAVIETSGMIGAALPLLVVSGGFGGGVTKTALKSATKTSAGKVIQKSTGGATVESFVKQQFKPFKTGKQFGIKADFPPKTISLISEKVGQRGRVQLSRSFKVDQKGLKLISTQEKVTPAAKLRQEAFKQQGPSIDVIFGEQGKLTGFQAEVPIPKIPKIPSLPKIPKINVIEPLLDFGERVGKSRARIRRSILFSKEQARLSSPFQFKRQTTQVSALVERRPIQLRRLMPAEGPPIIQVPRDPITKLISVRGKRIGGVEVTPAARAKVARTVSRIKQAPGKAVLTLAESVEPSLIRVGEITIKAGLKAERGIFRLATSVEPTLVGIGEKAIVSTRRVGRNLGRFPAAVEPTLIKGFELGVVKPTTKFARVLTGMERIERQAGVDLASLIGRFQGQRNQFRRASFEGLISRSKTASKRLIGDIQSRRVFSTDSRLMILSKRINRRARPLEQSYRARNKNFRKVFGVDKGTPITTRFQKRFGVEISKLKVKPSQFKSRVDFSIGRKKQQIGDFRARLKLKRQAELRSLFEKSKIKREQLFDVTLKTKGEGNQFLAKLLREKKPTPFEFFATRRFHPFKSSTITEFGMKVDGRLLRGKRFASEKGTIDTLEQIGKKRRESTTTFRFPSGTEFGKGKAGTGKNPFFELIEPKKPKKAKPVTPTSKPFESGKPQKGVQIQITKPVKETKIKQEQRIKVVQEQRLFLVSPPQPPLFRSGVNAVFGQRNESLTGLINQGEQEQKQRNKQRVIQLQKSLQKVGTTQARSPVLIFSPITTTNTKQKQKLVRLTPSLVGPRIRARTIIKEKVKKKKKILVPLLSSKKKKREIKKGFNPAFQTQVKEKGNWKNFGKPLPKNKATRLGIFATDNTPSRSFRLKPKGTIKQTDTARPSLRKFRKSKSKKARKQGVLVEKTKFAIDTKGEFKGITLKGLKANRRKKLRKMGFR